MKNKLFPLFFLTCLVVISCGEKSDPIFEEVMAIHDEVMPETGYMHQLKKKLEAQRNEGADSFAIIEIQDGINALIEADDAMFDWMREFRPPEEKQAREAYLLNEKRRIKEVSDKMKNSIANAEKILSIEK